MIINLSHEVEDIKQCIREFNIPEHDQDIVDFNTTIKLSVPSFFSICELQGFDQINERITREFIKDVGFLGMYKVNGTPVVQHRLADLPVFWCTDIAIKYPFVSPAKAVYLLKELFPLVKERYHNVKKVYVSISGSYTHYMGIVEQILKDNGVTSVHYVSKKRKFSFYKDVFKHLAVFQGKISWLKLRASGRKAVPARGNYFVTFAGQRILDENYRDFYYHNLYTLSARKVETHYWPMFGNFQTLAGSDRLPANFVRSAPGLKQFFLLLVRLFLIGKFFKVRSLEPGPGNSLFGSKELLQAEIRQLVRSQYFAYYSGIWIRNYFADASDNVKVFYQDEFYHTGRIITTALSNTKVKKIGVQHGLFDLYHTVYGIGEMELKNPFGPLPAPDLFTVWSEWFKDYFSSNNSRSAVCMKVVGSPKHFSVHQDHTFQRPGLPVKILWCTDNLELTQNDLRYLEKDVLTNPKYQVTLRKHPLYDYMHIYTDKLELFRKYAGLKVSENESIFDDIDQHDIVIVNCFTTAFLDAYLMGKPCIRLFPYAGSPGYLKKFKSGLLKNVSSEKEILPALESLIQQSGNPREAGELMDNNINEWENILYNN